MFSSIEILSKDSSASKSDEQVGSMVVPSGNGLFMLHRNKSDYTDIVDAVRVEFGRHEPGIYVVPWSGDSHELAVREICDVIISAKSRSDPAAETG